MKIQQLNEEKLGDLLDDLEIPYVLEDKTLMSPGTWKNKYYAPDVVIDGLKNTDFSEEVVSLFLDHEDTKAGKWIGRVENIHLEDQEVKGDLHITDLQTIINLKNGAKFGISPRLQVEENGNVINDFQFENFSVVWNPAVKTAYINNNEIEVENMTENESQESESNEILEDILERVKKLEDKKSVDNASKMDKIREQASQIADFLDIKVGDVMEVLDPLMDGESYPKPYEKSEFKDELQEMIREEVSKVIENEDEDEEDVEEAEEEPEEDVEENQDEDEEEDSDDEEEDLEDEEEDESEDDDELSDEDEEEDDDEELSEDDLKDRVKKLEEKLSQPRKKSVKATESKEDVNPDEAVLSALKRGELK